jgi:hypothetical protein
MHNRPISLLAQTLLPTPHLAVAYPQPLGGFDLLEVSFCCSTFNRSRSLALNSIRSVSIPSPTRDETGHFYFAQTGNSHPAATRSIKVLTMYEQPV